MDFDQAIEYLQNLTKFGFNFGLGRITELLKRLGNPHLELKVIHVGGTNGKGSTTTMLCSILKEAGYRAGAFTSPHLRCYTERYSINGCAIAKQDLARVITELKPHLESMAQEGFEHPTEFEVGTAAAFLYFSRQKVDYLVLEVGLGGAIDSTNVVLPLVSVITNVAMDHMDYLGNTIREIAGVKAGIIKAGVPLVTAASGEALEVIEEVCKEKNSPLLLVGRDVTWTEEYFSPTGQVVAIRGKNGSYNGLTIPLRGRHQQINAATAVAAAELLARGGALINPEAMARGLAGTAWPARLETMLESPLVLVDAAHNYDGAVSLKKALNDYYSHRGIILVLGMLGDKERSRVVDVLTPGARAVVVTRPNSPRAGDWDMLAREAGRHVARVFMIEDIREAVKFGLGLAGENDLVCVTGSFYMVAEAREMLLAMKQSN